MANTPRILLDTASHVEFCPGEMVSPTISKSSGQPVWKARWWNLKGGVSEGVQVVELANELLEIRILPTRGMGLWNGRCGSLELGWHSPVSQPVHPAYVNLQDRGGLGWLHGFQELLCRCGLAFNGPPGQDGGETLTLHGRIANLPAHKLSLTVDPSPGGALELSGEVDEASMFGPRWRLKSTTRLESGEPTIHLVDEVTNLGGQPVPLSLLYHINVGRPFLEAGAKWEAPIRELAPRDPRAAEGMDEVFTYRGPEPGYQEQAYFAELHPDDTGWTTALLTNSSETAAFCLNYQTRTMPCFTVWKNTTAEADGYVTGLEPGTNYPNLRPYERAHGRLPSIPPGGTYRTEFSITIGDGREAVAALRERVSRLQRKAPPLLNMSPKAGWSPCADSNA